MKKRSILAYPMRALVKEEECGVIVLKVISRSNPGRSYYSVVEWSTELKKWVGFNQFSQVLIDTETAISRSDNWRRLE